MQSKLLDTILEICSFGKTVSFANQPGHGIKIIIQDENLNVISSVLPDDHMYDDTVIKCLKFTSDKLK